MGEADETIDLVTRIPAQLKGSMLDPEVANSRLIPRNGRIVEFRVNETKIDLTGITKVDVGREWEPEIKTGPDGFHDLRFKDPGASRLRDALLSSARQGIYEKGSFEEQEACGEKVTALWQEAQEKASKQVLDYFERIQKEHVPVILFNLRLPGQKIFYYRVGNFVEDQMAIPKGLIRSAQAYLDIQGRLEERTLSGEIVIFDLCDLIDTREVVEVPNERYPFEAAACLFLPLIGGYCADNGDIFIISGGDKSKDAVGNDTVAIDSYHLQVIRHELAHNIDHATDLAGDRATDPQTEGFASMAQFYFSFEKLRLEFWAEHGQVEVKKETLAVLFSSSEKEWKHLGNDYLRKFTGAFYCYIYEKLGALAVKRFYSLISGNVGGKYARYERNCAGNLIKALETAANYKENFDTGEFITAFITEMNEAE